MNCDKCGCQHVTSPVELKSGETMQLCADCEWEAVNYGATKDE